jgi:replicative DNA helicase
VLGDLHEEEKTEELCLEAVRQNRGALQYVPENIKTSDFYIRAIRLNWKVLISISKRERTYAMCLEAVLQDVSALAHVREEYFELVREEREFILANGQN